MSSGITCDAYRRWFGAGEDAPGAATDASLKHHAETCVSCRGWTEDEDLATQVGAELAVAEHLGIKSPEPRAHEDVMAELRYRTQGS